MSTNGFLGFVIGGEEKIAYNHSDSYPAGLGIDVLRWLSHYTVDHGDELLEQARSLRLVSRESHATPEEAERFRKFTSLSVASGSSADWYCVLRHTQGDLEAILDAGVVVDDSDFPLNSLYCEYGYLADLDAQVLEVYHGFQCQPHDRGRFAGREPVSYESAGTYYPVALAASWPLSDLPSDDEFLAQLAEPEEG